MNKKNTLEEALLQIKNLEEAMKQNAKGILESTMKQELNDLLKEGEEEEVNPDEEVADDMSETTVVDEQEDVDAEDDENGEDLDNDETDKDIDGLDSGEEEGDEFGDDLGDEGDEEEYEEEPESDEEEDVFDMTNASDEEVLKVFKAMKPEDGIIVKKDGNKIEMETGDEDFIIKLDSEEKEEEPEEMPELPVAEPEMGGEEEEGEEEEGEEEGEDFGELAEDEGVVEVEIDECGDLEECGDNMPEGDVDEAARTKWNPHGDKGESKRAGLKSKKMFKAGAVNEEFETLKKQYNVLKEQNTEYKKALGLFKEKLNEVAVFNANLAYATRLFTEHSTTKKEKMSILKRFDSVSTLNESKGLFKTINTELSSKTVTESVVEKISKTPSTSTSKEMLEESKAYENPQFKRMKDLMNKVK